MTSIEKVMMHGLARGSQDCWKALFPSWASSGELPRHANGPCQARCLLVWTEMQSHIKGSIEALHSSGQLEASAYFQLSQKRASVFSTEDDRRRVYSLFTHYEKVKRQVRSIQQALPWFLCPPAPPHITLCEAAAARL